MNLDASLHANGSRELATQRVHHRIFSWAIMLMCSATLMCCGTGWSQEQTTKPPPPVATPTPTPTKADQWPKLDVNWLYGAFVPKGVPLEPLTGKQRWKLYLRESFTTPGIYFKTVLFTAGDQITNSPSEWGRNWGGFGRRLASREGQFVIQNSFSSLGDALLQYEPRYNRCNCSGFWPRTRHAIVRNFVTYNKTELALRPQFASYGAALGAGMIKSLWTPGQSAWSSGYHGMITQVWIGAGSNWIGEFAPEINRIIRKKKPKNTK